MVCFSSPEAKELKMEQIYAAPPSALFSLRTLGTIALTLCALLFGKPATAGDSPWSRINGVPARAVQQAGTAPSQPSAVSSVQSQLNAGLSVQNQFSVSPSAQADSDTTTTRFDIEISLEADPQTDSDRMPYETVIHRFNESVYQSTNGAHRIRTVRIHRNSASANETDVVWRIRTHDSETGAACWPSAHLSGYGKPGKRILMCENFGLNLLRAYPNKGGDTFAHEWGHYAYGLYDEYQNGNNDWRDYSVRTTTPLNIDTPSNPSIMHSQWDATNALDNDVDLKWLEFSTDKTAPFNNRHTHPALELTIGNIDNINVGTQFNTNAQYRGWGESGWETLTRNTTWDILMLRFGRMHFPDLVSVSPSPPDLGVAELPAADLTRCAVSMNANDCAITQDVANVTPPDIIWVGDGQGEEDLTIIELLIDRSGSMGGPAITNAKSGAKLLVDALGDGESAIGVASFASNFSQDFTSTEITAENSQSVKGAAQAAIDTLSAGGGTSLYAGALSALDELENSQLNGRKILVLLSDGAAGDAHRHQEVIDAFLRAKVPIYALCYGDCESDVGLKDKLAELAQQTGGDLFFSPTTNSDVRGIFANILTRASNTLLLSESSAPLPTSGSIVEPINIDDTLGNALIAVNFRGAAADVQLTLRSPSGQEDTGVTFDCTTSASETSCTAFLDETVIGTHQYGEYSLVADNATNNAIDLQVLVSANPTTGDTYDVKVDFSTGGEVVTYPVGVTVRAAVVKGG